MNECKNEQQRLKKTLKTLQKTAEYEELLPLIGEAAYYEFLQKVLYEILNTPIYQTWSHKKRLNVLYKVIDDNTAIEKGEPEVSDMFIENSKDIIKDIERAQKELYRIVDTVENPEMLYDIPEYQ
jgi:hypothetical protein